MSLILVVDDQSDIRRLLAISLRKEHEVIEAADGRSALEMARRRHPAIVLLDVMMPGELDGLEVLDALKASESTSHILVAIISARAQVSDHDEAQRRGADAFFVKPFSPREVVAWIKDKIH